MRPRNGIGMPMLFNQRRTKIGFLMLRFDIEGFELAPNEMRQSRRDHGVEHAHPKHIAGNRDAPNFGRTGERPQDDGETPDREQGIVKTHREVHGVRHQGVHVFRDSLIRVIRFPPAFP